MTRRPSSEREPIPGAELNDTSAFPPAVFPARGRGSVPTASGIPSAPKLPRASLPPPSANPSSLPPSPSLRASLATPESAIDPWHEYHVRIAEAPHDGSVRGLFFSEILRLVPALRGVHRRRYLPFSMYPLRDYMQLLVDAGRTAYPSRSPEVALKQLGMTTYSTFASSIAGMSLLSSIAVDVERVVQLVPQIYALTIQPSRIEVAAHSRGESRVELRDVWTFPESYHIGVWLGGLEALGVEGEIDVIRRSWCSVDFHVHWKRK